MTEKAARLLSQPLHGFQLRHDLLILWFLFLRIQ